MANIENSSFIQQAQADYVKAKASGDTAGMQAAHDRAEQARASVGYSGGADGSGYITIDSTGGSGAYHPINGNVNDVYGVGYAYVDKYGFSHVVNDIETALNNSGDGNVQLYTGRYGTGYALSGEGNRFALNMPGVVPYGNERNTVISNMGLTEYYNPNQIAINNRNNAEYKGISNGSIFDDVGFNEFNNKLSGIIDSYKSKLDALNKPKLNLNYNNESTQLNKVNMNEKSIVNNNTNNIANPEIGALNRLAAKDDTWIK